MASSIETTSTTTTLKNNGNTYLSVDTNDDVAITNTLTATSPTFVTPNIGAATVTSLNGGQLGGRRNIVYNGEMKVAQRSASETGLGAASGYFTVDRFGIFTDNSAGRFTMAQVADGPAGFANCLKLTTTTADTSIAASEYLILQQRFEGQDLQQLQKGTATSKQVTVSFYVKGNASATYTCELNDVDNTRQIAQEFAVTTSWNRIELTFAADTSDPLDDDNARSLDFNFWLHAGSNYTGGTFSSNAWKDGVANTRVSDSQTSIYDSTDRTFFITGLQMETGATATAFESRSYGTELALCQRYYQTFGEANGAIRGTTTNSRTVYNQCIPPMRATPTVTITWTSGTTATSSVASTGFESLTTLANTTSLADQTGATATAEL